MTHGKKFFACFNHNLTLLQKQEVQKGLQAGLTPDQVESYASTAYNHRQMREIRLALEHAPDVRKNASLYEPSMDVEEMEKRRHRIEKGEKICPFSLSRILLAVCFVLMLMSSVLIFLFSSRQTQPYLHLTASEVTIPQGASFEPLEYVADYSSSKGELILPGNVDTSTPGVKAAVYVFRTPHTEITRILNVEVIAKEQ